MFSDVGYGAAATEFAAEQPSSSEFLRFFAPKERAKERPGVRAEPVGPVSSGGNEDLDQSLVAGLNAASRRAHMTDGSLVLVSDLNDSQDDRDALVTRGADPCPGG